MENLSKNYFLPYQLKWINDEAPLKLYEKSRRIGITYATSYRAFRKCMKEKENSNFVQWVSSRDETTAKEFITDYIAMWAKAAGVIAKGLYGELVEVIDPEKDIRAFVVYFPNGARIYSLSSNPAAFAGKGGDVLIDEFDLHRNQGTMYDMAYPCITWGGQLEIVSAYDANGSEHTEFAMLVKEIRDLGNPKGFSFHSTTLEQAIEQGFVEKVNEVKARKGRPTQTREEFLEGIRRGCRTIAAFNSQYRCIPNSANGEQAVRPNDLLNSKKNISILKIDLTGDAAPADLVDPCCESYISQDFWKNTLPWFADYALGYDVARKKDLAVIWIDGITGGVYTLIALVIFRNCKFESQKKIAESILDEIPVMTGAGDETGMGGPNCEHLATLFQDRFVPVNFSSLKTTLGTMLSEVFEQQRQELPLLNPEVGADIAGIRKDTGGSGKLIFTESSNPLEPDSHCDMGWSCALAKFAGETIDAPGGFFGEPAGVHQEPDRLRSFMYPDHDRRQIENAAKKSPY